MENAKPKWRNVGAIWKPKPNARSEGSGELTLNGMTQKFVLLKNNFKEKESQPDYVLMSGDEPETDEWQTKFAEQKTEPDDDVPF